MAVTWTISTLERNTNDGVVVAHWRASDADGEHVGSSYGTCGFTPNPDADGRDWINHYQGTPVLIAGALLSAICEAMLASTASASTSAFTHPITVSSVRLS